VAERTEHHDVLIIGSGPAGLFCADHARAASTVVVEQGSAMPRRLCPETAVCDCRPCDVLEGEGGAGSFSDGKVTLSPTRGTHGTRLFTPGQETHLATVEATIRQFAPGVIDYPSCGSHALPGTGSGGAVLDSYPLIHVGSDGIRAFGLAYAAHLRQAGADIRLGQQATALLAEDGRIAGALIRDRRSRAEYRILAGRVVLACGLAGTSWLETELARLGVRLQTGPADLGIRLESTATALEPLISTFYDFKISHQAAGISLRSFCVNGDGYVTAEYHRGLGIRGVNGHSYLNGRSGQSNLAIVATITMDHHPDPKSYVRETARGVNRAAGGYPVRQELGDLLPVALGAAGVLPSNPRTRPGRLQDALPAVLLDAFTSYIRALGQACPPVMARDTLLYAPEIKYYAYRVPVDPATWESTDVAGLHVIGNAAGYTASLSAAALTGIIAGRAITGDGPPDGRPSP
jgi:uncharacterized FAD-dependent dehydrogenase